MRAALPLKSFFIMQLNSALIFTNLMNENFMKCNFILSHGLKIAVLLTEHAVELLLKAFRVGVHSKVESGSYINEAMQLLNLETMQ